MKRLLGLITLMAMVITMMLPQMPAIAAANFNYGEALQKSLMFYEFQRSGKLPADKRDNWRGDSGLKDGSDVGLDLTGGWYDAGDHVKFNLPMSYTLAMLAWSVYEDRAAYVKSGQLKYALDNIKWASDYFIRCHPTPNEYYFQVGDGVEDHNWWGPAEVMTMKRPSFKVTAANPGATVVAETAAALAITSLVFKDTEPSYAATCLKHAKELYTFAESTKSDTGYGPAENYYRSWSQWWDELSWAGAWLYIATNDSTYLEKAEGYVANWKKTIGTQEIDYKWAHCWDDVHTGAALLLARITNKSTYKEYMEKTLDFWTVGYKGERIKYSPKGLAYLDTWGSLRYATTTAFIADVYASWSGCTDTKVQTYKTFAKSQVDYALGSAGRSYVVGFGTNPPEHPHHRTAHGSWNNNFNTPADHRHVLYGALVGGPDASDAYVDEINNYITNEVACDYNAGFTGILARLVGQYGGTPIPDFKAVEKPVLEVYVGGAAANADGKTDLKVFLYNQSAWPARSYNKLSFRYFMDLSELYAAGRTSKDVSVIINYSEGGKAAGIFPYDESKHIYYALIDFPGVEIVPGGPMSFRKEAQIVLSGPGGATWDGTNDFSFKGFVKDKADNANISVYNDGVRISGAEPNDSLYTTPPATSTPIPTSTSATTPPTPTPTTNVPGDSSAVSGYVSADFATEAETSPLKAGFKVEVDGTQLSAVTNDKGYFNIPNIKLPAGQRNFSISISKAGYLTRNISNFSISIFYTIGTQTAPAVMWAGDFEINGSQDGAINMSDIMELAKLFNTTSSDIRYNEKYDLNMDKAINMSDIMIVAKQFNKTAKDYPAAEIKAYPIA